MRLKSHAYNRYVALVKMRPWKWKPSVCDTPSHLEYHIKSERVCFVWQSIGDVTYGHFYGRSIFRPSGLLPSAPSAIGGKLQMELPTSHNGSSGEARGFLLISSLYA